MITTIIEELKNGNHNVVDMFVELEEKWTEILHGIHDLQESDIAERLSNAQWDIERICNSRNLGKAIMPWSAFAHLYSCQVGFEDNGQSALKLANAFQKSTCSLEVKSGAKAAAKVYHVSDYA